MKTPTINNRVPWKEQFRIIILTAVTTVVKNVVMHSAVQRFPD
jgi:hypothetical protein